MRVEKIGAKCTIVLLALTSLLWVSCSRHIEARESLSVIPYPVSLEAQEGEFVLSPKTVVKIDLEDEGVTSALNFLGEITEQIFGKKPSSVEVYSLHLGRCVKI